MDLKIILFMDLYMARELIEVEAPWVETDSNYNLLENMTFQNRYLHFNRYLWCSLGKTALP